MESRKFLANLVRSAVLIAALIAILMWALERDGQDDGLPSLRDFPRRRQAEGAPPTVPVEPSWADAGLDETERPPVVTEAFRRLGASEYHRAGYLGQGVTVAVIDTQFDGIDAAIERGELPPDLIAKRLTASGELVDALRSGRGPHGTACAEIIYDLAPGAQLYLLQVDGLLATADQMFSVLQEAGVRIVSISISPLAAGRSDGTGVLGDPPVPIYDILRRAYEEQNMLIAMSAGNYARQHYAGVFRDLDGDHIHEFSQRTARQTTESVAVTAQRDQTFSVHLSWDDWGIDPATPRSISDYDLYVYDREGGLVASSVLSQAGKLPPTESVHITPVRAQTYTIQIVQKPTTTGDHNLRLWVTSDGMPLSHSQTPEGSLGPPADADTVVTVGAVSAASDRHLSTSSRGPTADGRIKPDVTSYAQVSVSHPAYGPLGFTGTSAATPHIAGMAALLLTKLGNATSAPSLRKELLRFVADRGSPGPDSTWGAGIAALPPLSTDVEIRHPEPGSDFALDGNGRAALVVMVRRSDGSLLRGLGPDAFEVTLDEMPGDLITVQDLGSSYVVRARWPRLPERSWRVRGTSTLRVAAAKSITSAPVRLRGSDPVDSAPPARLTLVTPIQGYEAGDFIHISAALDAGVPVSRALVVAQVAAPVDRHDILVLHDDGQSRDGLADDGVYGARYPQTQVPGRYTFRVSAYGSPEWSQPMATADLTADVATNLSNQDRDGLPGNWEMSVGLNHLSNDRLRDPDADGLTNAGEFRAGSDPFNWDTDGDWLNDLEEVSGYYRTRPYTSDSDGGGRDDGTELRIGTDPLNPEDDTVSLKVILLPSTLRRHQPRGEPSASP